MISTFKPKEVKKPKLATCKICAGKYVRVRPLQSVCLNIACALEQGKKAAAKKERVDLKVRMEAIKTRSDWIKEAQIAFNAFIRERDRAKGCISCGASLRLERIGGYDCGHYRSVGSAPHLRFDERNAAGQCKKCNRYGSGRAVDYRIVLRRRIGLEALEALESDQTTKHYTIEELKQIKATYKAKLRELLRAASE